MIVYGIPLAVFSRYFDSNEYGLEVWKDCSCSCFCFYCRCLMPLIALYDRKNREKLMPKIVRKVELPDGFIVR